MKSRIKKAVAYGLYPVLLAGLFTVITLAVQNHWDYGKTYGLTTLALVLTLMALERLFPLAEKWSMTGRSFLRDLKYIALDIPVITLTKSAFGLAALYYSGHHCGLFSGIPFLAGFLGYLLIFELIQYSFHRFCHEGQGPMGRFLWRTHLAHHLPDKVYVIMHAVFNPLNAFITTAIVQIPLILLGISPEVVLAATLLMDLQSLVSHFNVDIRAGFLNYLFIGTETHRYHHGANPKEAGNYGNTLAVWDIVFGTFYYKPGQVPENLGVSQPAEYPDSNEMVKVVLLPFQHGTENPSLL